MAKPSPEPRVSQLSLYGEPEASGSDVTLRKKRRRRKKPKQAATDSTSEESDSERALEEKRKLLTVW